MSQNDHLGSRQRMLRQHRILRYLIKAAQHENSSVSITQLQEWISQHDSKSTSSALHKTLFRMLQNGLVEKAGRGHYRLSPDFLGELLATKEE